MFLLISLKEKWDPACQKQTLLTCKRLALFWQPSASGGCSVTNPHTCTNPVQSPPPCPLIIVTNTPGAHLNSYVHPNCTCVAPGPAACAPRERRPPQLHRAPSNLHYRHGQGQGQGQGSKVDWLSGKGVPSVKKRKFGTRALCSTRTFPFGLGPKRPIRGRYGSNELT